MILKRMVGDDSSARTREQTKQTFEELSMDNMEAITEYLAREKSLAPNVKCHGTDITEQEITRQALNSLPTAYAPDEQNLALKTDFSYGDLESGLVCMEELNRSLDGTNGSHALAAGFKPEAAARAGGARDVEAAMVVNAASATVEVARRINDSRTISRSNSSISCGTSNISDRGRNSSTSGIIRDVRHSGLHSIQGNGIYHAFVSVAVSTGIFCQSAAQYPLHQTRIFLTRTRAHKLPCIHIVETTPILRADLLHHCSQPPRRLIRMDRSFRPNCPRALSPTRLP